MKHVGAALRLLVGIIMLLVALCVIIMPRSDKIVFQQPLAILLFILVLVGVAFLFHESVSGVARWIDGLKRGKKYVFAVAMSVMVVVQVFVCFALATEWQNWDAGRVLRAAETKVLSGEDVVNTTLHPEPYHYFATYQNNMGVLTFMYEFFRMLHSAGIDDFFTAALLLNVAFLNIALVFLLLCARRLFDTRTVIYVALLGFIFITLSPHSGVAYTDTLAMPFPILTLYCFLGLRETKRPASRLVWALLMGIFVSIGFVLKPTAVIILIAIALVVGFMYIKEFNQKILHQMPLHLTGVAMVILGALAVQFAAGYIQQDRGLAINKETIERQSMPAIAWMAMGMNEHEVSILGRSNYGGYDRQLVRSIARYEGRTAKQEKSIRIIKERLKELGVSGYTAFVANKTVWIFSDGTFTAYQMGNGYLLGPVNYFAGSGAVQRYMSAQGDRYHVFANFVTAVWLLLLVLIAVATLAVKTINTREFWVIWLTILGITAFTLLFEGRARYLYLYIPIFILAGGFTIYNWERIHKQIARRITRWSEQ